MYKGVGWAGGGGLYFPIGLDCLQLKYRSIYMSPRNIAGATGMASTASTAMAVLLSQQNFNVNF